MSVIQRKVCLLGATAVGKTSLVRRYVESLFSDRYHATIGVKIDRKLVEIHGAQVSLLLWDLQGEDELQRVRTSYLRGAAGIILVADGTRPETLLTARSIMTDAADALGTVPAVLLLNKSDLADQWRMDAAFIAEHSPAGVPVIHTSAKSGSEVEGAFSNLVVAMNA